MKNNDTPKASHTVDAIAQKISEYERLGKFDLDVLDDPESRTLYADEINYLPKGPLAFLQRRVAFACAYAYYYTMKKSRRLVIDTPTGLEHLKEIKGGRIITSNHFSPLDSFIMQRVFDLSRAEGKMYKIIREGNYTSFSGFYGFLMRNCYTLPLSSDIRCAAKLSRAIKEVLSEGNSILVYPEQSLWQNYRKPKPMKQGAFDIAVKHGVPVVPVFTVMKSSGIIGEDGAPVTRYVPHVCKAIYPDTSLSRKEASEKMKEENYSAFKEIYEREYGIPLTYTCGVPCQAE